MHNMPSVIRTWLLSIQALDEYSTSEFNKNGIDAYNCIYMGVDGDTRLYVYMCVYILYTCVYM